MSAEEEWSVTQHARRPTDPNPGPSYTWAVWVGIIFAGIVLTLLFD